MLHLYQYLVNAYHIKEYTIDGLHETIMWLRQKPGGLKLNKELAFFLGDLFIWVVDYWAGKFSSQGFTEMVPNRL